MWKFVTRFMSWNHRREVATTTEVYPDSPKASDEICNEAQVAAIVAALDFVFAPQTTDIPRFYPIGTPGKPWTDVERKQWKESRKFHRSYKDEVLNKLDQIKLNNNDVMEVVQYGALSHNPQKYPLFAVKSKHWEGDKPTLLVTGGVHGYETSGVQGALLFLQTQAAKYTTRVNIVVAPCISPWAYEHIERWNADLKDPNRSFKKGSETFNSGTG